MDSRKPLKNPLEMSEPDAAPAHGTTSTYYAEPPPKTCVVMSCVVLFLAVCLTDCYVLAMWGIYSVGRARHRAPAQREHRGRAEHQPAPRGYVVQLSIKRDCACDNVLPHTCVCREPQRGNRRRARNETTGEASTPIPCPVTTLLCIATVTISASRQPRTKKRNANDCARRIAVLRAG